MFFSSFYGEHIISALFYNSNKYSTLMKCNFKIVFITKRIQNIYVGYPLSCIILLYKYGSTV